jgi:fructuronate reductase
MTRLGRRNLDRLRLRPEIDPGDLSAGIVHVGFGAFHRAHQSVYTQDAIVRSGDQSWGIVAVAPRSRATVDALVAQDGFYTVLTRDDAERRARILGVHMAPLHLPSDPAGVMDALARPDTRVVTLTVTEKAYTTPSSVIDLVVSGLQRRARHAAPVTVLCCDNLRANGVAVERLVTDQVALLPEPECQRTLDYLDGSVTFPSTVVDRIVPATTPDDLRDVAELIGARDEVAVIAEPYSQWVIEDRFAAGRPPWESVGATLTADVSGYEHLKLRLVNAPHSALAYLGLLRGHRMIAESVRDDAVRAVVQRLVTDELMPTVAPPEGLDPAQYAEDVLQRFSNSALRYTTRQVAMDGSRKLPERLAVVVQERWEQGQPSPRALLVVAAWLHLVLRLDTPFDDPLADALRERARVGSVPPAIPEVLGDDLDSDAQVRALLTGQFRAIERHGIDAVLTDMS